MYTLLYPLNENLQQPPPPIYNPNNGKQTKQLNRYTPQQYQCPTNSSGRRHRQLSPPPISIPPRDTDGPHELPDNENEQLP